MLLLVLVLATMFVYAGKGMGGERGKERGRGGGLQDSLQG
jgi:hypothetical protein